jgi:hypothetical protein
MYFSCLNKKLSRTRKNLLQSKNYGRVVGIQQKHLPVNEDRKSFAGAGNEPLFRLFFAA